MVYKYSDPLDVLMVAHNDWANTGFRFSKCLRTLGINALSIKAEYHQFLYPEQSIVHPELLGVKNARFPSMQALIDHSKIIHFIGSTWIDDIEKSGKTLVMQHGGSNYRQNYKMLNDLYADFTTATIIQCPDLLGLGAKNEHLIYYPVDTDYIKPTKKLEFPLIIGHFPSNPEVKGTKGILEVINKLEHSKYNKYFKYIGVRSSEYTDDFVNKYSVNWMANLKRVSECDVIIETCNPSLEGKVFGEWGNTAIEAAAMGKLVISNSLAYETYIDNYGCNPGIHIANTPEHIETHLENIFSLSGEELNLRAEDTLKWVIANHSIEATAQRLWTKIYKELIC